MYAHYSYFNIFMQFAPETKAPQLSQPATHCWLASASGFSGSAASRARCSMLDAPGTSCSCSCCRCLCLGFTFVSSRLAPGRGPISVSFAILLSMSLDSWVDRWRIFGNQSLDAIIGHINFGTRSPVARRY